jgi:hypothetical protein
VCGSASSPGALRGDGATLGTGGAVRMGAMGREPLAERIEHVHTVARRLRRRRLVALVVGTPLAWALLMLIGPVPFSLLVFAGLGLTWVLGWKQRARNKGDLKYRRLRTLQQGMDAGGPSQVPTARHKSPDPNAAENALYGSRHPGLIRGAWPRGRI